MKFKNLAQERVSESLITSIVLLLLVTTLGSNFNILYYDRQQ